MKKILLIGAFGYKTNKLDGQTVKTRNIYQLLKQRTQHKINFFDTLNVRSNPFLLVQLCFIILRYDIIIIIPCSNSLNKLFIPLYRLSHIFKFEIICICIGGWQMEYFMGGYKFKPHPKQFEISKRIKAFLPEISSVTDILRNKYKLSNCETFPNFRLESNDKPIKEFLQNSTDQLKLVFAGRINKQKGYETIFKLVDYIILNKLNIKIDFYGQIDNLDYVDFISKININQSITSYKGYIEPHNMIQTLRQYDAMLFPTKYYTEGVPGAILDAYLSGIPVIATTWKHAHEVIIDNTSGILVPFDNCQEEFNNAVVKIYHNREFLLNLKKGTTQALVPYSEETAWNILKKYIE